MTGQTPIQTHLVTVVVGDAEGRGSVVICYEITTNSAVHSRRNSRVMNEVGFRIPDSLTWGGHGVSCHLA